MLTEIPRAQKERYIVFEERDGHYDLIDDFVHDEVRYPVRITVENGAYVYYSNEKEAFRRPVNNQPAH
ncbi:MAG TPA: hypothetical protein VG759_27895 [Candidatus Angelobacter sp.]|nr:hypothetical protein [Candidatus Angelobacter sp.]